MRNRILTTIGGPTAFFAAAALASGCAVYVLHGSEAVFAAIHEAGAVVLAVAPQVLFGLLIGAFLQQLVPHETVSRYLGNQSRFRGLVIASALGCITPGGPFASFPIIYALFVAGADIGALIAYLTAWALIGIHRIVIWELPFMGVDFAILRFAVCLPLPILAGMLARLIVRRTSLTLKKPEAGA